MQNTAPIDALPAEAAAISASDPATAAWMVSRFADEVLRAWIRSERMTSLRVQEQLGAIRAADPALAELLETVFLAPEVEARLTAARELAARVQAHTEAFEFRRGDRPLPTSLPVGGIITPV